MPMTARQRLRFAHGYLLLVVSSALIQQLDLRGIQRVFRSLEAHEKQFAIDVISSRGTTGIVMSNVILNVTTNLTLNSSGIEAEVEEEVEQVEQDVGQEVEDIVETIENNPFKDAVLEASIVVCTSEFLDRSWVVSILCILQYGSLITWLGALPAFACHVALSACVGRFAQDVLTFSALHVWGAAILALFGCHSLWECYHADPDKLAISSRERAATDVSDFGDKAAPSTPRAPTHALRRARSWLGRVVNRHNFEDVTAVFVLVFRAEWGDATQLALVTLQTTEQQSAVCCGSLLAFVAMLWAASVVGSALRAEQLRERPLLVLNCLTLWAFAAISLWQAWKQQSTPGAAAFTVFRRPSAVVAGSWGHLGKALSW